MIKVNPIATKFSSNPVRAISMIRMRSLPNTTALGGVATGIMKAIDEEMVAGRINTSGCVCRLTDQLAKIGRSIESVATLEVSSVKNVTLMQMMITNTITGTGPIALNDSPI